jgi:hypothetical protein
MRESSGILGLIELSGSANLLFADAVAITIPEAEMWICDLRVVGCHRRCGFCNVNDACV